jgi:predicted amidohydrolase
MVEALLTKWTMAVVQMGATQDVGHNLKAVLAMLAETAQQNVQLAVLPECVLSGYMYNSREEALSHSVYADGQEIAEIAQACASQNLHAVVGYLERDGDGGMYNSAVLIDDDGQRVANYRKTHLPYLGLDRFVDAGQVAPPVVATKLGRIGLAICYDLRFPESARCLALGGADVIAQPSTWPSEASMLPDHFMPVRACENRVFMAAANRPDKEAGVSFIGRSQIVAPTGQRIAEADSVAEGVFVASIDLAQAREKRIVTVPGEYEVSLFIDRRPELYGEIIIQHPTDQ